MEDGISVKRTYDALGNLISVVDPAGTITYNLRPDGQPSSIVAPGNVTTSFGYDGFGRRTSLGDPSSGTTTYAYDASGNLLKETNANNKVINTHMIRIIALKRRLYQSLRLHILIIATMS